MDTRRIFAAIEVPDDLRQLAADHIDAMRREDTDRVVRWERPEKMHITLKFIVQADKLALAALDRALGEVAAARQPFRTEIAGTGVFPDKRRPRVLWFGIGEGVETIKAIAADIEAKCRSYGLPEEARSFHPHLTAGRVRDVRKARPITQRFLETGLIAVPFVVDRLVLIESNLQPGGSQYAMLSAHDLRGGSS